jgi:NOL1/NOP2/sun family putative RNA methylase
MPRDSRLSKAASAPRLRAVLARYRPLLDDEASGWDTFIEALCQPLPVCVWAHPQRCHESTLSRLIAEGESAGKIDIRPVPWQSGALRLPSSFKAGQHWWYCAGLAHAQEEASQLPVRLLDVHPGQRVLDLCAAPGGKTAQIALRLKNRGTLLANDFARERIAALQGNLDRLGMLNTSTTWGDGGNFPAAAGTFDRVLVDAPCSSEGTLRRNRSLIERLDAQAIVTNQRLQGRQLALLRKAVQLCRAGGRIVYSTCTFAPEENECIVAQVLEEQAGRLQLCPASLPGLNSSSGVTDWNGQRLDASLAHCVRLWPHQTDTGGFFVAVLEKSPDAPELPPAPPAELITAGEDTHWLPQLSAHYGWPEEIWQALRVHRQTRRGVHLLAADHQAPAQPSAEGRGLFFQRTNIRPPKLTTAGALLFGALASRQVMELDAQQRDAYLSRTSFVPSRGQRADGHPGQVIVRYLGYPLGVALLTRSGTLESLFPRRWSGCGAR